MAPYEALVAGSVIAITDYLLSLSEVRATFLRRC
jgi:hypothetical protein